MCNITRLLLVSYQAGVPVPADSEFVTTIMTSRFQSYITCTPLDDEDVPARVSAYFYEKQSKHRFFRNYLLL